MVQSVSRAMRLLVLVAGRRTDGSGAELSRAAGLAVPTAHHLLSTLVDEGLLARDAGSRYVLGPTVGMLSEVFQREMAPPEYLSTPLRQLAAVTGDTSYLAAWRDGEIRILASILGHAPVHVSTPSSPYVAAHARATGKVLLAYASESARTTYLRDRPLQAMTTRTITDEHRLTEELEHIRACGYGFEIEEFHTGVACVSAPVLVDGVAIAAYALSTPVARFKLNRDALIEATLSVAASAVDGIVRARERVDDAPVHHHRTVAQEPRGQRLTSTRNGAER